VGQRFDPELNQEFVRGFVVLYRAGLPLVFFEPVIRISFRRNKVSKTPAVLTCRFFRISAAVTG
jgi:hypothetical protein